MLLQKLLHTSTMSSSIDHFLYVVLALLFIHTLSAVAQPAIPTSRITVVGVVFCDTCSTNSFSRHSYFLPGVDVHIQCKFKASSPKTAEQIDFSVNRTTDKHGVYKLEIPHVDGVDCVDGMAIESLCQAGLIKSSSSACSVPGLKTSERNATLCGNHKEDSQKSEALGSSKFFLPYYLPPYGFFWPPLPQFPPLFPSPPSSFPFPPLFPSPPSLPFPFPPLPQFPPVPSLFQPPPPPAFSLGDPRTWIPNFPTLAPPPPPAFNLRDPRTWIPYFPPSPPSFPQNKAQKP